MTPLERFTLSVYNEVKSVIDELQRSLKAELLQVPIEVDEAIKKIR